MKYVLGIDIGTGSVKAVALNLNDEAIAACQEYYPTSSPVPGHYEQHPGLIRDAFVLCLLKIASELGNRPLSIGISSAMHSLICVDETGEPLSEMMTWADSRSAQVAERLKATEDGMAIYTATGTPIHPMSPLCKIIWLSENEPELFGRTAKFISIKEFIWHYLFDEYCVDHSIASCTGLFDIVNKIWHQPALKLAGIKPGQLAEPVATSYTKSGSLIPESKLAGFAQTHFVIGASDGCLANLGSHAEQPGIAALTIGTSGAVRINSKKPIADHALMPFSYILDESTYICGGPINNGGMVLQWLLKKVLDKKKPSDLDFRNLFTQAALAPPGSKGLLFLPYLSGERAPIWDAESCGVFFGLRTHHQQEHLVRAVIEGICFSLNDVLHAVLQYAGELQQINISGSIIHAELWMQILADITGKDLMIVQNEDASAVGAAYIAAKASDVEISFGTFVKNGRMIRPNPNHQETYRQQFHLYKQLYQNLKTTMHQLYQFNS